MSMKFLPSEIMPEIGTVTTPIHKDHRGFFLEMFRNYDIETMLGSRPFVQENFSVSKQGVLRGLHYQAAPMHVGKLVTCLAGQVFDVAVDVRPNSPTFGKWYSLWLNEPNVSMWIAPGFAHGFCTVSESAVVLYRQTNYYSPEHDRAIAWNDPDLDIGWPLVGQEPILSKKDREAPLLSEIYDNQNV